MSTIFKAAALAWRRSPSSQPRASARLGLRVLAGFAAVAALAGAALTTVIWQGTVRQDQAAAQASVRLAETAIRVKKEEIGRVLRDYAVWAEAHDRLVPNVDPVWLFQENNIGANIAESLGYEYTFVLNRAGRTVYAVHDRDMVQADAFQVVEHGLDKVVAAARRNDRDMRAATGVVQVDGMPALVAAGVVWDEGANGPFDDAPVMVFVDLLDRESIESIGADYLLRDLIFDRSDDVSTAATPIFAADHAFLGHLRWQPDRPGSELLISALPALGSAGLGFLVLAGLVGRSLRRASMAVSGSEARFRDLAEVSSDWFWETDAQLRFRYFSERMETVTGSVAKGSLGRTRAELGEPHDDPAKWRRHLEDLDARQPFRDFSYRLINAEGQIRHVKVSGKPICDASGRFSGYRGTGTDITDEVEANARCEHLSLHDPLTGLPNRLLFTRRLEEAVAGARRDGRPSATVCLDVDKFKDVNDTLGHPAGDALLQEVARRLREIARESDTVARLGGDEFAFVLSGCGDPGEAEAFCHRILSALGAPFQLARHTVQVGASLGVAFVPVDAQESAEAMRNADLALYRAKHEGRGTYRFFAPEMNTELQRRHRIEQDLRRAIANDEFELHFQPKFATETLTPIGVEALVRWRHPERGLIMPDQFIDLAEQTGLIVPIGAWVLEQACAQAARWPGLGIAVNLSPVQFRCPRLVETVRQALDRAGLEPGRLELEVTETLFVTGLAEVRAILAELKRLGVRLAMDDFGTGYSSLGGLQNLPFDHIKIDRSFVARLGVAKEALAIVRAIVTLGHGLAMATTAEGVEDQEQLALLRSIGCDEVQGYLLGRPMPADAIDDLLPTETADPAARDARNAPYLLPLLDRPLALALAP